MTKKETINIPEVGIAEISDYIPTAEEEQKPKILVLKNTAVESFYVSQLQIKETVGLLFDPELDFLRNQLLLAVVRRLKGL